MPARMDDAYVAKVRRIGELLATAGSDLAKQQEADNLTQGLANEYGVPYEVANGDALKVALGAKLQAEPPPEFPKMISSFASADMDGSKVVQLLFADGTWAPLPRLMTEEYSSRTEFILYVSGATGRLGFFKFDSLQALKAQQEALHLLWGEADRWNNSCTDQPGLNKGK